MTEAPPPRIFKGGREGHEDWITEMASNQKMFSVFVLFVCFVVISSFFWLRLAALRMDILENRLISISETNILIS